MMRVEVVNRHRDGRPQYRLGDAVLKRDERYGRIALQRVAGARSFFEGTILYEYACRIDRDSEAPQWPVLSDIVRRKSRQFEIEGPGEDELVAHLRLGDGKGYGDTAATFVDYVTGVLDELPPAVSKVSIVTAIHFGAVYLDRHEAGGQVEEKIVGGRQKVDEILGLFAARGMEAKLVSHPNADVDFCYLANAQALVLGNGHFSVCAAMVSGARVFVPSWSRRGTYVDIDELLGSRDPAFRISSDTLGRA